ncbi:MAG: XTP/dITP diphosphatase [Christensenellaceae bacterium]|jgi:XTP/dITP diphosphohydrolase
MSRLIIATGNQGKVREIKAILGDFYDEVLSLKDAGIDVDVVEDGDTFHANAAKKAVTISKLVDCDVLADDSGLCVSALSDAPGIYSARYAGADATDEQNNQKLLAELKTIQDRRARFCCALVVARNGMETAYTEGEVHGVIIDGPKGENGFGYDPLFYVEEYKKTFGELSADIKNEISHRARALRKMKELLG